MAEWRHMVTKIWLKIGRLRPVAKQHKVNVWSNVDLSSKIFCRIYPRAISQDEKQPIPNIQYMIFQL